MKKLIAAAAMALMAATGVAYAKEEPKKAATAQKAEAQLDINSASRDELMKLKGIGDARADAIIKGRLAAYKAKFLALSASRWREESGLCPQAGGYAQKGRIHSGPFYFVRPASRSATDG